MARDPIGVLGGRNLYAFAMNRPNDLSDRFGLSPNVNPYTSGDMCSAYPCGEAETEFGHNPYLQEVFEETLSGVSSGMVTSLWPGGAVAEGITGVDTVEFLSGEEIYHGASYYLAKGVTEVVVGSVEMVGGGSMFASGAALTVASVVSGGGIVAPASVSMAAGGAAVAVQGYTTAGGGLSNVGQGIDLVFNKGDESGGNPPPLNVKETPVYRGGSNMQARPVDVKLTPEGNVNPARGISLSLDPTGLERFGGARQIKSVPEGLQVVQRGKPGHYELVPSREITLEQYQQLLNLVEFH